MKSALKLLVFFGIGCLIGIVLVCAGIVSFTDMTWNELVQKLAKIEAFAFRAALRLSFCLFPYFQLDADSPRGKISFEAFRHRGDRWTMPDAPA